MPQLGTLQVMQLQEGVTTMIRPPMGKLSPCGLLRVATSTRISPGRSLVSSPRCVSSEKEIDPASVRPARPLPWLFVGIGNPGKKYEGTRHNVGFQMIDAIAQAEGISLSTVQFKALLGKDANKTAIDAALGFDTFVVMRHGASPLPPTGQIGDAPVLLAKPQTFMNLSGESVKPLASYYKIPPERILTIYDDLDLEFAVMKLLAKGGHGGHNGMKSILQHLGSKSTARLRIGIGRPPGSMDPQAFVLQKFSSGEKQELNYALDRALEAIRLITTDGLEKAVSTWNQVRKSKISKMVYSELNMDK